MHQVTGVMVQQLRHKEQAWAAVVAVCSLGARSLHTYCGYSTCLGCVQMTTLAYIGRLPNQYCKTTQSILYQYSNSDMAQ